MDSPASRGMTTGVVVCGLRFLHSACASFTFKGNGARHYKFFPSQTNRVKEKGGVRGGKNHKGLAPYGFSLPACSFQSYLLNDRHGLRYF